jgi:hypothetical protein
MGVADTAQRRDDLIWFALSTLVEVAMWDSSWTTASYPNTDWTYLSEDTLWYLRVSCWHSLASFK